jgi:hypothetical protein
VHRLQTVIIAYSLGICATVTSCLVVMNKYLQPAIPTDNEPNPIVNGLARPFLYPFLTSWPAVVCTPTLGLHGNPFSQLSCSEHANHIVHRHAQNMPGNLGRLYTQCVWASLMFKMYRLNATFKVHWSMGFHISAWASTTA